MTTHSTRTLRALEELRNCVYPFMQEVRNDDENSVIELRKEEWYGMYKHSTRIVVLKDGSLTTTMLVHELTAGEKFAVIKFSAKLVAHLGELCAALREEQANAE